MDKVDEKLVRQAYREAVKAREAMADPPMELPAEDELDLEGLVRNLVTWYRAASPAEDLCECTTCGGDSDARLDACPFCGDSEIEEGEGEEAPAEEKPEPEPEPEPAPAKAAKGGKGKAAQPAEGWKPGQRKPKPGKALPAPQGGTKASEPAPRPKGTPLPKKTPAGQPEALVEADGVEVIDKGAFAVDDLDASVRRVEELKRTAAKGIWELGQEIYRIHEAKLWRLRTDSAGKSQYKTFSQFVKAELGIGYSHADRLMKVAQTFPRELMEKIGIAKCSIALHVPPEARERLLEGAENKTAAQLSDEAKALKGDELPKPPRGALTVAMAPGVFELPLVARPKKNARKLGTNVPAKALSDDPWGLEQLPNNVHVYYAVTRNAAGELILRIERRRVSEQELFTDEPETGDEE